MVSRENAVVVSSGVVALLLGYGGLWLTDLGTEVLIGTILFVGVVAPQLVNGYLGRKQEE
jgi:dTDP-4-amino-4,6-dideoxygalactose transaminase